MFSPQSQCWDVSIHNNKWKACHKRGLELLDEAACVLFIDYARFYGICTSKAMVSTMSQLADV